VHSAATAAMLAVVGTATHTGCHSRWGERMQRGRSDARRR
jgi:hypothetical protein